MVRNPPSERSFASCLAHDLTIRIEDRYEPSFLVDNVILRCDKYLKGWEQVSRERNQPLKQSEFAQPVREFITESRTSIDEDWLVKHLIIISKTFAHTGTMPPSMEGRTYGSQD